MSAEIIPPASPFEAIKLTDPTGENRWSARDLMPRLGYDRWENFTASIERAKITATNSGADAEHHFVAHEVMVAAAPPSSSPLGGSGVPGASTRGAGPTQSKRREQMTAVTMRADQVRKGDKINLTAQVTRVLPSSRFGEWLITIEDSLNRGQTLRFMGGEELSVERPDPKFRERWMIALLAIALLAAILITAGVLR